MGPLATASSLMQERPPISPSYPDRIDHNPLSHSTIALRTAAPNFVTL